MEGKTPNSKEADPHKPLMESESLFKLETNKMSLFPIHLVTALW